VVDESRRVEYRLVKAGEHAQEIHQELPKLANQIEKLQAELELKKTLLNSLVEESEELRRRLRENDAKKLGLCIR